MREADYKELGERAHALVAPGGLLLEAHVYLDQLARKLSSDEVAYRPAASVHGGLELFRRYRELDEQRPAFKGAGF